jgi:GAF domain-containing protein
MNPWTWPAVFSGTLSLLILIYAYITLWRQTRQPSMGLWALGWAAYTIHFLLNHALATTSGPPIWHYASLAVLGESGFLLYAGTSAFTGRLLRPRAYAWMSIPLLWALIAFAPTPIDPHLTAVPIFLFSGLVDLLTALRLIRYIHGLGKRGFALGMGLAYGSWAGLKIASPFTPPGSPAYLIAVLLTDALALGLAFSLIGLSLIDAERSAKRRAERLDALAALTAAAGHLLSTDELLQTAIDELARLLEIREGVGIFLYPKGEGGLPRLVVGRGIPTVCREGVLHQDCICLEAIRAGRIVYKKTPSPPGPPCPKDCPLNVAVPMIVRGRAVGAVCAVLPPQAPFTGGDQHTLETIARQLGLAVENSRLAEERMREIERLQALAAASRWMALGLELEKALRGLVGMGARVVGADRAAILLHDPKEDRFKVGYARGLSEEYIHHLLSVLQQTPDYRAIRTLQEVYVEDAWHDPRAQAIWEAAREEGFRSYLVLPLVRHQKAIGVLAFYHDQYHTYDPEDRRICQALADQAAAVVENYFLHQETQRQLEALSVLHEIETHIASALDLEDLLEAVGREVQRLLKVSTFYIGLYQPEEQAVYLPLIIDRGERRPPVTLDLAGDGGLSGWVIRTRQPLWIDDIEAEVDRLPVQPIPIGEPTRSVAVLPLIVKDQVLGVFSVQSYIPHAFDEDQKRLLTDIAHQVAIAVENARLYAEQQRRIEEANLLLEIAIAINSSLALKDILREVTLHAARACGAQRCTILLLDEQREWLIPLMSQFASGEPHLDLWQRFKDTSSPRRVRDVPEVAHVIRERRPLFIPDALDSSLPREWVEPFDVRSLLIVPLVSREQVVGVMALDRSEVNRPFTAEQVNLAITIAAQAAIATENARLYEETSRRLAQTQVLREVMLAAASTLDFDQVLERTIQVLNQRMEVEFLCVALPDPDRQDGLRLYPAQIGYAISADEVFLPMEKSVCGRVFQTGEPLCIGDVRQTPYYYEGSPEVRSELAVPIRVGDQVIGVLNVESREIDAFDEEDLTFYTAIAGQLGVALENARLYREERRRRQEAETLYRAVQALTTTLDPQEVLDRILTELQQVVPYDSASVQLLEGDVLKIISGRGFPNLNELLGVTFDPRQKDNPNGRVLESRAPVILEDAPAVYENFRRPPHADIGIRAWMGVPLLFGDRAIGMITLDKREPGFYTEEHARLAMAFAAQAAVAIENARLYRRLEEQSAQLARAVEELQDLDRLRNQLVQNVSHELRTPLTLIQGYAELLLGEGLGALEPAQRRALRTMQEYIRTLSRLIYNLTALRAFPRETLALMPISIAEVIEQVLAEEEPRARSAGIRFHTDFPEDLPPVLGDRERLDLVFYHLIDNAIKFSPDGGDVHIRAWANEEWVHVSVKDEGIGIAPEHLYRIFERFYQVDGSTTRRFGGMGVGLALVWEIVEAHGGTVEVESEPGKGSNFTVRLPQAKEVSS